MPRAIEEPTDIADCALWLDAADLSSITKDGSDKVSQWSDKSGNANHVVQAAGIRQPTHVAGALNGLAGVRFVAASATRLVMAVTATPLMSANGGTVFVVGRRASLGTLQLFYHNRLGSTGWHIGTGTLAQNYLSTDGDNYGNPISTAPCIFTAKARPVSATLADLTLAVNRAIEVRNPAVGSIGTTAAGRVLVGAYDDVGNYPFDGDLFEVTAFDRALTDGEIVQVEQYLASKWAIVPPRQLSAPTELAGCALWLDASDVASITKDGSNKVSQWSDKSGNAKHAVQATGANQPTYNATGFGGLPGIDWGAGAVAAMRLVTPNIAIGRHTMFAVVRGDAGSGNVLLHGTIGNFSEIFCFHSGLYSIGVARANIFTGKLFTNWLRDGVRRIVSVTYDGTCEGHVARRNGVEMQEGLTVADPGTDVVTEPTYIGNADGTWYGNNPMAGVIAEIVVFDRCLGDGERFMVEQYLSRKWLVYTGGHAIASPVELPDCAIWLDAADLSSITKDGSDLVSQWSDKSGNANHFTTSGVNRPTYSTYNGNAIVSFDGTDDFMTAASNIVDDTGPGSTIIVACRKRSAPGTAYRGALVTRANGLYLEAGANSWGGYSGTVRLADENAGTAMRVFSTRRGANHTPHGFKLRADGASKGNFSTIASEARGSTELCPNTQFADMDVLGVVVYTRSLSDGELGLVEQYLQRRYGLSGS